MTIFRTAALAALLLLIQRSTAFVPVPGHTAVTKNAVVVRPMSNNEEEGDPTKVWYAGLANTVQNVLTNSPAKLRTRAFFPSFRGELVKTF